MSTPWSTHNSRNFSLEAPAGWRMDPPLANSNTLRLHSPDARLHLTLSPHPDAQNPLALLHQSLASYPRVRIHNPPHAIHHRPYPLATAAGVEFCERPTSWWRKLFTKKAPRTLAAWRFWSLAAPAASLTAVCHGPTADMQRLSLTLDRIIASIRFPRIPEPVAEPTLSARVPWLAARAKVLPLLLTNTAVHNAPASLVTEAWVNNLHIAYTLTADADSESSLVSSADAHAWAVSPEDLHAAAMHNLVAQSHEHAMQGQKGQGYTLLCLTGGTATAASTASPRKRRDNPAESASWQSAPPSPDDPGIHDGSGASARMLLPDLHRKLKEHLGPTFFAAAPTRNLLLAFSVDNPDLLPRFRQQVQDEFSRAPEPLALSPKLFLVTPDGITGDPAEQEDPW